MKSPHQSPIGIAMTTKCSTGVSKTTDNVVTMRSHKGSRNAYGHHRKSAVELLAASKASYVKSSEVLNHKQELKHPENLSIGNREFCLTLAPPMQPLSVDDNCSSPARILSNKEINNNTSASSPDNNKKKECEKADQENKNVLAEEVAVKFKKPMTPCKPALPPRPKSAMKPTTPPKPGPKPVSPTSGKPVPPPRQSPKPMSNSVSGIDCTDSPAIGTPIQRKPSNSSVPRSSPEQVTRCLSSVLATACETGTKDVCDRETSISSDGVSGPSRRESQRSSNSSKNERDSLKSSVSAKQSASDKDVKQPLVQKPEVPKRLADVVLPAHRQLHRSQSDVSSCVHSRASSDFSDLSSRLSRTSSEIARFFNEMGIDRTVLDPMRKLANTKTRDLDDLSSFGSLDGHSLSSRLSHNDADKTPVEGEHLDIKSSAEPTSIVERNARIIKWLCNVRKAHCPPTNQSVLNRS